jgi:large subunit ribosomal protein L25
MAQQTTLEVAPRTILGKATKHLRRDGIIPGNIYGHKESSLAVQVNAAALDRLRRENGLRNIISLRMPGSAPVTVLVRHIQHQPVSGQILHIDFSRASLGDAIESKVPLHFVGEAPGVKVLGGTLLHLLEALPITYKVSEIVEYIEADISGLTEIGAIFYARDVQLPAGAKLLIDLDEPIAKISAPRGEVAGAGEAATETPTAEKTEG